MFQIDGKCFYDGEREIVFHKSEFVETISSLHSLQGEQDEKQQSTWLIEKRMKLLQSAEMYSLEMYGKIYASWLLIMDIATYISCQYYNKTGKTHITFEEAIEEYRTLDDETYLSLFLGMPALGFTKEDAKQWLENPDNIEENSLKKVGQYIAKEDILIFIKNIDTLKKDLEELITKYWKEVFSDVWTEIEKSIDKTIKSEKYQCAQVGNCIQYISNLHNQIHITRGQIHLKKEIPYVIDLKDIKRIHIFPSTFSDQELLIDKYGSSLIIYYNLNLRSMTDEIIVPEDLKMAFKALGDENRLKIVKLLWGAPATTQYLTNVLGLAQSTVSAHLKLLKSSGILKNKMIKKYVYYEINQEFLEQLNNKLIEFIKSDD